MENKFYINLSKSSKIKVELFHNFDFVTGYNILAGQNIVPEFDLKSIVGVLDAMVDKCIDHYNRSPETSYSIQEGVFRVGVITQVDKPPLFSIELVPVRYTAYKYYEGEMGVEDEN